MKLLKFPLLTLLFAGIFTLAFFGCKKIAVEPSVTSDAKGGSGGPNVYSTLSLACDAATTTLYSIGITVTAGPTGAPSGFTIQWMTKADYDAYGWPLEGAIPPASFCKGSFSGNANASRYNLSPGGSVTVSIGSFLYDNGASTDCPQELLPCTQYVFRAFAHGDNVKNRSAWSATLTCSTECDNSCTKHGFGYWKNHCELITSGLTLGTVAYTATEICTILNTPSQGNGLIILAHQLIAAKLNGLSTTATADADAAVGSNNVLTDSQPASWQATLIASLRHNNEHCSP